MQTAGNDNANARDCAALKPGAGRPVWRQELTAAIRDPDELLRRLQLDPQLLSGALQAGASFPLLVPPHYLGLIEPANPLDPLLLQVLPRLAEVQAQPLRFVADPLQETGMQCERGLLQKYHGRSLLVSTGACAIHCRYCFRRHFPYEDSGIDKDWSAQLQVWQRDSSLQEVILSGGDPLMLSDQRLQKLFAALADLPRLRRIRIHSRMPLVIPARINESLLDLLARFSKPVVCVVHANHPREIDPLAAGALRRMRDLGVTMLNQSVLLRGINDQAQTLAALSERLFEAGTLPYYLHQLDPVLGSAHFEIPDREALHLHRQLADLLPGYLLPRLVRELPGEGAKRPLVDTDMGPATCTAASS